MSNINSFDSFDFQWLILLLKITSEENVNIADIFLMLSMPRPFPPVAQQPCLEGQTYLLSIVCIEIVKFTSFILTISGVRIFQQPHILDVTRNQAEPVDVWLVLTAKCDYCVILFINTFLRKMFHTFELTVRSHPSCNSIMLTMPEYI